MSRNIKRMNRQLIVIGLLLIVIGTPACSLKSYYSSLFDNKPDDYETIDDLSSLISYCESDCIGTVSVTFAHHIETGYCASLHFSGVDSIEEANENALAIRTYFENNPDDPIVIKDYCIILDMTNITHTSVTSDTNESDQMFVIEPSADESFGITYTFGSPVYALTTIDIGPISADVPSEMPADGLYDDVRTVHVLEADGVDDQEYALLEEIYPNAEIVIVSQRGD